MIHLPPCMDTRATADMVPLVRQDIARHEAILIDGSSVTHVGPSGMQLLLAIKQVGDSLGVQVKIYNPSMALIKAMDMYDLSNNMDAPGLN